MAVAIVRAGAAETIRPARAGKRAARAGSTPGSHNVRPTDIMAADLWKCKEERNRI